MTVTRERKHIGLFRRALVLTIAILALLLLRGPDALALGTQAGTVITNSATVHFTMAGSTFSQTATGSFTVAERMELTLTWQDAGPVSATAGQANAVTTFRLTNAGNGTDSYTLSATGAGIGGDQFDPAVTSLYLDANGNSTYDAGTDTLYTAGTGTIPADGFKTIFVLSSIPATTLSAGDLGIVRLIATSSTGTGPAGTILPAAGDGGTDAVIGSSQGTRTASGSYVISPLTVVNVAKTATVTDPSGGSRPQPGATIHYTLTVTATGPGTANGVLVTDAIPPNTAYTAGTLRLDGALLTDAADLDAGAVASGIVSVSIGNMTSASPAHIITFDVTID
jgi:uncharacterized repeat protein (TIGR01451 family)